MNIRKILFYVTLGDCKENKEHCYLAAQSSWNDADKMRVFIECSLKDATAVVSPNNVVWQTWDLSWVGLDLVSVEAEKTNLKFAYKGHQNTLCMQATKPGFYQHKAF